MTIHADKTDKPKKLVSVTINSRPFELEKDDITFEELVALAFPNGSRSSTAAPGAAVTRPPS